MYRHVIAAQLSETSTERTECESHTEINIKCRQRSSSVAVKQNPQRLKVAMHCLIPQQSIASNLSFQSRTLSSHVLLYFQNLF